MKAMNIERTGNVIQVINYRIPRISIEIIAKDTLLFKMNQLGNSKMRLHSFNAASHYISPLMFILI